MRLRAGNKQIHQYRRHTRQYGQNALQIEKRADKAERPHAKHIDIQKSLTSAPGVTGSCRGLWRNSGTREIKPNPAK